jgi:hypothetical protein
MDTPMEYSESVSVINKNIDCLNTIVEKAKVYPIQNKRINKTLQIKKTSLKQIGAASQKDDPSSTSHMPSWHLPNSP